MCRALSSTMKGSQASSSPPGPPEGRLEGLDLSLTGLPPPVSRRPNSASAAKPVARSISVATGSEPKRKALEATAPGSSRAINNLRRSSSTTQVHQPQAKQAWAGPLRPAEPPDFLMLFESSPGGNQRPAGVSRASSEKGATWNVLDDQPRALPSPPAARSPCALDTPAGPRRREGTVSLAPNFTANNRSNKAAVGNFVTTMVHNNHGPADAAPKSSNRAAPSLNNLVKAATREGEGSGGKPQKNSAGSNHGARNNAGAAGGPLRRREVTEEEAERFIHQVNQAAITIQRWYRHQAQRRRAQAASLGHLLASKLEGQQKRPAEGDLLDLHRQREAARRKAREEKARQARRAAIQELQQKRAQKSGHGTQEAGKPQPAQEPPLRPGDGAQQTPKANNTGASFRTPGPEDPCQPIPDASPEAQRLPDDKLQDASAQDAAGEALETGGPGSRAQCRATLDELLDTLRLLEEAPEPLPRPRAYHKDRYAWSDEEDDASSLTADNLEKFGKLSAPAGPPEDGTLLSEAKLQSIMCFLDEMEQSGRERPAAAPQGLPMEEGPRRLESASEASASVMRLKLEVEEKKQAMALLQRALAQQRDLTIRRVKETEKELGRQLRQQREHYEATIQRHLSFIDQLIEDKKTLGEKCAAVVAELKQGEQRRQEREAQMREQHALEMKKLKELMSATEKVRREKWMNEKTRKINPNAPPPPTGAVPAPRPRSRTLRLPSPHPVSTARRRDAPRYLTPRPPRASSGKARPIPQPRAPAWDVHRPASLRALHWLPPQGAPLQGAPGRALPSPPPHCSVHFFYINTVHGPRRSGAVSAVEPRRGPALRAGSFLSGFQAPPWPERKATRRDCTDRAEPAQLKLGPENLPAATHPPLNPLCF